MSFAQPSTAKGMEHADWSGLGSLPTPLEEHGLRVGEIAPQKITQVLFPEDGGRDGDQAETVGTQHPICLEPELLFLDITKSFPGIPRALSLTSGLREISYFYLSGRTMMMELLEHQ